MMRHTILAIILALCLCCDFAAHARRITVIEPSASHQQEHAALLKLLASSGAEAVSLPARKVNPKSIKGVDLVIFHRNDSAPFTKEERDLSKSLLPYVKAGGNLCLTMEAVKLLNEWGVEPTTLTVEYQDASDGGYGRAVGYHSYLQHPLFEDLCGGAYVWNGREDNMARTIGFSGTALPSAQGSKVIGINWAYIHYHEDRKLIWETPLGKGKILAIGAYLNYSQPNANASHLARFTRNLADWMTGSREFSSKENEWIYDTVPLKQTDFPLKGVEVSEEKFRFPAPSALHCSREAKRTHFWNASGSRVMVTGREKGGVEEVWTHPMMAARDISTAVKLASGKVVWLDTIDSHVTRCPEFVMREYEVPGGIFREMWVASPTEPLATLNCEWEGDGIADVFVTLTTNLRLMWPYSHESSGTLSYSLNHKGNIAAATDRRGNLSMIAGFSKTPKSSEHGMFDFKHRDINKFTSVPAKNKQVSFLWDFDGNDRAFTLYIAGGGPLAETAEVLGNGISANRVYADACARFDGLGEKYITIETDDPEFNEAYKWAVISTDRLFSHTPALGKSLMAGFWGTSRGWNGGHAVSGRPGYAWYFGRDTAWTGTVLNSYGDFAKVRDILTTFGKYQDPDGKVYHELTTSGSAHYDASDATPLYLILAGDYLRKSGDAGFIESQWEKLKKSLAFCRSTDTDGDGLIENTAVGHGWQESHQLHGAHTEVYLAALWAEALKECAFMASVMGEEEMARKCAKDYEEVRKALNSGFWNPTLGFFNHGLMKDGSWQEQKCVLGGTPLIFGLADPKKALSTARNFSSKYYSTDWGVTMVGYDSPYYALGGYNYGNVWPFHNGCAALAEYGAGLGNRGFRHAVSGLRLFKLWDYGNIPEVITGDKLSFTGICPHQQWSSSLNLKPLYDGMLGLKADALNGKLALAPNVPADWSRLDVKHIPLGDKHLALRYSRDRNTYRYIFEAEKGNNIPLAFSAALPLATSVLEVTVNGKRVDFRTSEIPENIKVELPDIIIDNKAEIAIRYNDGIAVCLNLPELVEGMGNDGLKIEAEHFNPDTRVYTLAVAGRPGKAYDVDILTLSGVLDIEGAELVKQRGDMTTYRVNFVQNSEEPFVSQELKLKLK